METNTSKDCLFCKIVKGTIHATKIYEDKETLSFLDIQPSAPGHAMVILKEHGKSILDYSEEELGRLMKTVQKIAAAQEKSLNCDSITIGINHLEESGVHHLHVHLIPRWKSDNGHALQGIVKNPLKEEIAKTAEKIKSALA